MDLRQNSSGYAITVNCYQSDGVTPFDFTGYTVSMRAWVPGVPSTVVFGGTCTVSGVSNNKANYVVQTLDLAIILTLSIEVLATKSGVTLKFQSFDGKIKEAA